MSATTETVASAEFAKSQQGILRQAAAGEPFMVEDTLTDPVWAGQQRELVVLERHAHARRRGCKDQPRDRR